ncbi:hypothetical protein ACFL96_12190 [Thermoproteota archaeon]
MARLDMEDMNVLEDKNNPCDSCKLFDDHGKKCFFYWDNKKDCSQHSLY